MGCSMSYEALSKRNRKTVSQGNVTAGLHLTDTQKRILKESWEVFEPKKTAIGRKMFVNLFQVHPEMQNLFPEFRGAGSVEKLEATQFLNGHAKRLMTAVENAIISINDMETFVTYLHELGRRHKSRKLKPHYLERMGTAMMQAFGDLYTDMWTAEMEEAWRVLYDYVAAMMIKGLNMA